MSILNTIIPFASSLVSFIFAFLILRRFFQHGGLHHLLWGIGMLFYGIGGFCEGYYGALGWNPYVFRLWYLFGALLVAAWLGQGTVYMLAKRRWANALMILLAIGSIYGTLPASLAPGSILPHDQQSAHRQRAERSRHRHPRCAFTDTFFQSVWHGHPGRRRRLFGLAIFARTRAAPPGDRECVDRFWGDLAGVWRDLQPHRCRRPRCISLNS